MGEYGNQQEPEQVIGQHGQTDCHENDRQDECDKTVSIEVFDNARDKAGFGDTDKRFRMLFEGMNEPMAQPMGNRCVNR